MSYCRNPYYIYSNGEELLIDGKYISDKAINVFLYKILLENRRSELIARIDDGRQTLSIVNSENEDYIYEDDLLKEFIGKSMDKTIDI